MKLVLLILLLIAAIAILVYIICAIRQVNKKQRKRQKFIEEKGKAGEDLISELIGKSESGVQIVFNDYVLDTKTAVGTTQIDHIVINTYGIFVIETKYYGGIVRGKDTDDNWIQKTKDSERSFYNPVKQNAAHIEHLKQVLPYGAKLNSIVVFINTDIKGVKSSYTCSADKLKGRLNDGYRLYSWNQIKKFGKILEKNRSSKTSAEHAKNIKNLY